MGGDNDIAYRFVGTGIKWRGEPLVLFNDQIFTVELAILRSEMTTLEEGIWTNSRSTNRGVVDLLRVSQDKFKTVAMGPLPSAVQDTLELLYSRNWTKRGCTDLIIWNKTSWKMRLIEIKLFKKVRISIDQERLMPIV